MSQKKVDKYKEEKKNRAKKLRQKHAREYALVIVGFAALGAAVGYPLGRHLYQKNFDKRQKDAKIESAQYDYWFDKAWQANVAGTLGYTYVDPYATATDAIETIDATSSDAN